MVSGHVGIRGNESADTAAKEALEKEPEMTCAKYIHYDWQKKWNEDIIVSNKLHDILPNLSDELLTFCNTRKEDTMLNRLHIGHSYFTHSFPSKKEEPSV